jgi:hypothetical protein
MTAGGFARGEQDMPLAPCQTRVSRLLGRGQQVKRFQKLFDFRNNLRNLNQEAAIDSMRNVLAVLGLGLLIGDFATMRLPYVIPGFTLLIAVWYADYLRHDLPAAPVVNVPESAVPEKKEQSSEQRLIDPIDQLGRAS